MFILAKLNLEFHEPKLYGPGLQRLTINTSVCISNPMPKFFPKSTYLGE